VSTREPAEVLSDDLQRVLARYRDGTAPTEHVRARLWLRLGGAGVGAAAATSTVFRVIVGGAIAGALAAVGIVASHDRDGGSVSRESTAEPEPPSVVAAEPPVQVAVPPAMSPPPAAPAPSDRAVPPRERVRASAPVVEIEQPPSLADEIAVLERARIALGQDDPQSALRILAEHERRFGHGTLVEERKVLRIVALCSGSDATLGREEARTFLASHPTAALAARIRSACE
jgi:hypothetical protein